MPEVRSVTRAFEVLKAVAARPLGVTEIASRTQLPKSTVARLLATLEAGGAVAQEPDARYGLGPAIADLTLGASGGRDLRELARPFIEELASSVREAAGLSIADGANVRYVDQVSPPSEVQVRDWTGTTAPM